MFEEHPILLLLIIILTTEAWLSLRGPVKGIISRLLKTRVLSRLVANDENLLV